MAIVTIRDDENNGRPYVDLVQGDTSSTRSISDGDSITERIEVVNDVDWYRTTLTANHCYEILMEGADNDSALSLDDPYIVGIYKSDGEYISYTYDNDSGVRRAAQSLVKLDTTGTYFISVGYYRFDEKGTDNRYRLTLTDLGTTDTSCGAAKPSALDPPIRVSVANDTEREWRNPQAYLLFDVTLTVSLGHGEEIRVDYTTVDGTGTNAAEAGLDYEARSGTLVFGPGDYTKRIGVPIIYEEAVEPIETMRVQLSNLRAVDIRQGAEIGRARATGTIYDREHDP